VARVLAKKHLVGLRENAMRALKDQGMLAHPLDMVMEESVMPWVLDQMGDFLGDEEYQNLNLEDVVRDAFEKGKADHLKSIQKEKQRREDVIREAERRVVHKEQERQARREARERRRKEEELMKLKQAIKANFVDKGEVREHLAQIELLDLHGNYERNRPFAGTLGGQLMQLALVVQVLKEHDQGENPDEPPKSGDHKAQAKKTLKDLLTNAGLFSFVLNFFKEMKLDSFVVTISKESAALLESFKVSELHKLNEEQLKAFKQSVVQAPGHPVFQGLRDGDYRGLGLEADTVFVLLEMLVDIAAKKIPSEVNFAATKVDSVAQKVRLVAVPKHVQETEVGETVWDEAAG